MSNALLVAHTMIAPITTTLFLFQMATLVASISAYFVGEDRTTEGQKTYTRSTSNKEVAATARHEGICKSEKRVLRVLSSKPDKQKHQPTREVQCTYGRDKLERGFQLDRSGTRHT
jgi:hypothetical protein